eukprot:4589205-Amphidinium_carterae.2
MLRRDLVRKTENSGDVTLPVPVCHGLRPCCAPSWSIAQGLKCEGMLPRLLETRLHLIFQHMEHQLIRSTNVLSCLRQVKHQFERPPVAHQSCFCFVRSCVSCSLTG